MQAKISTMRAKAHIQKGIKSRNSGNYKLARAEFSKACEKDSASDEPWYLAADLEYRAGRYQQAMQHIKKALAIESKNSTYWALSAQCNEAMNKNHDALADYKKALQYDAMNSTYKKKINSLHSATQREQTASPTVTKKTVKEVEKRQPDKDGRIRTERILTKNVNKAMTLSKDRGLVCGFDGDMELIDTTSFRSICRYVGHRKWIEGAALFSDGRLVSGSNDGCIKIWSITGKCINTLEHGTSLTCVVAIEPNKIISGNADGIKIWDANTGRCEHTSNIGVNGMFAIDDNRIAVRNCVTSHQGYEFKVLDARSLQEIKTINGVRAQYFYRMPNGNVLGIGNSDDATGYIIIDNNLKIVKKAKCLARAFMQFAACVVDNYLVCHSAEDDASKNTLHIIDLNSGVLVKKITRAHPAITQSISQEIKWILSLENNQIASGSWTDVLIWDCKILLPDVAAQKANVMDKEQWTAKGHQHYQKGEYTDAMQCYENALNIDKKYVNAMVGKANVLYTTREFYDSFYLYQAARIQDSSAIVAWEGEVLSLLEINVGMAKESVTEALKKFPQDENLLKYKAEIDQRLQKAGPSIVDKLQEIISRPDNENADAKKQDENQKKQQEEQAKQKAAEEKKKAQEKQQKITTLIEVAKNAFKKYDLKAGRRALEELLNVDINHKEAKKLLNKYSPHEIDGKEKSEAFAAVQSGNEQEALMWVELATNKNEICNHLMKHQLFFTQKRSLSLVQGLVKFGYVPNNVNLVLAVLLEHKETEIFELLINQPYTFVLKDEDSDNKNSPLFWACETNNKTAIRLICDKYKINDHHWWLAFMSCITRHDAELARYLITRLPKGANQSYDKTPYLIHAAGEDCASVVDALLEAGADLTAKSMKPGSGYYGCTAKEVAQKNNYAGVLNVIKKYEPAEIVSAPTESAITPVSTTQTDFAIDDLLSEIDVINVGVPTTAVVSKSPTNMSPSASSTPETSSKNESLHESKYIAPEEEKIEEPQKPKFTKYQKIKWDNVIQGPQIGNGGFGKVYKGSWQGIDVAIKTLHKEVLEPPEIKAFEREAEIMSTCRHPNIVVLHGACDENGHYALILEYMPRKSLYDLHKRDVVLDWYPQRWQIALDVCHAISYLHSANIIHRDLKSLNVLIDEHYRAKVSDFGMAKVKTDSSSRSQSTSTKFGTAAWRAPEMIRMDDPVKPNKLTDIYALGLVLWELYSRKVPFHDAPDEMTLMFWVANGKTIAIGDECPTMLKDTILRCTSKEASKRPEASIVSKLVSDAMAHAKKENEVDNAQSWHFDSTIKSQAKLGKDKPYVLLPAGKSDIEKVVEFYSHHPVPGMDIGRVEIIYNPKMNRKFVLRLSELQEREGNDAFEPKWHTETLADWRKAVSEACNNMAVAHYDNNFRAVKILPLWHGTKTAILDSIFRTGFANLATTDAGFFGKGIYSAHEAEYSYRVYSDGALILNWVSFYSAYPVVDGDMGKLTNKANYANYDAHFVPVVPASNHPDEVNYFPTKQNQQPQYHEVVVFDSAQCLPRYVVHLTKNTPLKGLLNVGLFKDTVGVINLTEAIRFVYSNHLAKAYDLPIVDEVDWSMMDWQFSYDGTTVPRPNHGLAHTLRASAYVFFVVQFYLDQNESSMSAKQISDLKNAIPWLQMCMLFFVAARRNEIGFHHNPVVYQDYRVASGEAMKIFLLSKAGIDKQLIEYYSDAVINCYTKDDPAHRILRICHDLDLMRCTDAGVYKTKLAGVATFVGEEHSQRLATLALKLIQHTGDRIMGNYNHLRTYEAEQFVICSTNIDRCLEQIELGIKQWQIQEYGAKIIPS